MAFVATESSMTITYTVPDPVAPIQPICRWNIDSQDIVPTNVQIINLGTDPVDISWGVDFNSLGNTVAVAGNSTDMITVQTANDTDLYVGAYATATEGQCNLTPGIEQ